jgi:hypothetical protein
MKYNTIEVLAKAFTAYRVNGSLVKETRRYSEETPSIL